MTTYIPGVCNIGPDETRSKYALAVISTVILAVFLVCTYYVSMPNIYKAVVFFPLFLALLCYMQAANSFCIHFGLRGLKNMEKKAGTYEEKIEEVEFRVQDRDKAKLLILVSFVLSIVGTGIAIVV